MVRLQLLDQAGEHAFDLVHACVKFPVLDSTEKAKVVREEQVVLEFTRRAHRDMKELFELVPASTPTSFCNIGGDGGGRAAHLSCQAIALIFREQTGRLVNAQGQFMALSPDVQLLEILHSCRLIIGTDNRTLITQNYARGQADAR